MKKFKTFGLLFFFATLFSACERGGAPVTLPVLIGDNTVFQRGEPLKLWGSSKKNARINVRFCDKTFTTRADANGNWSITLGSYRAGGPYEMQINRKTLRNIMLGDVWVCSGQSNMEWPVIEASTGMEMIEKGGNRYVHVFKADNVMAIEEQAEVAAIDGWQKSSPESVAGFSAVGYFFANEIQRKMRVPIGIVSADWGGSPIEVWMRRGLFSEERQAQQKEKDTAWIEAQKALAVWQEEIDKADKEILGETDVTAPDYEASGWDTLTMPAYWELQLYPDFDGIVYLRKEITLPKTPREASIILGCIDDMDETYINGVKVGSSSGFNTVRTYRVEKGVLKAGKNVIVIRITDNGGNGGIRPVENLFYLLCDGQRMPLNGTWQSKATLSYSQFPEQPKGGWWNDSYLFNGMISPLTRMPIKGVIWYQGESNVYDAAAYKVNFEKMITDWRRLWGMDDFPFLYVQIANFKVQGEGDRQWPELRQVQLESLQIPNTAMAVTIDIGDPDNIHPTNKAEVGRRLALGAEKVAYGRDIVHTGPLYRSFEINGNRITVSFDSVGGGLKSRNSARLNNFEVADATGKWYPADAKIEGDKVAVTSVSVNSPVAVRYAWSSSPENINFYNAEGLPASPFVSK